MAIQVITTTLPTFLPLAPSLMIKAAADAQALLDAQADAANAVPDLQDGEPPTPVEIVLENSLEQVTSVVVATTAQSTQPLDNTAGSNPDSTSSDTTGNSTWER